ncbi:MAG: hypothetical protein ACI9TH_001417 [Kiritimatiellia bacterium]
MWENVICRQKRLEIDAEISLMRAQKLDAEVNEVEIGSVVYRAEHLLMNAATTIASAWCVFEIPTD